ncbi:hypothetical protein P8452_39554 [Trifolium repens]|nr:hypothetical protein P8452_39554 [Trifolium repens]
MEMEMERRRKRKHGGCGCEVETTPLLSGPSHSRERGFRLAKSEIARMTDEVTRQRAALWKGKYPERYLRQASGNNDGYNCLLQAWIMVHFPRFGAKYVDRKYDHRNPVAAKFYCMKGS